MSRDDSVDRPSDHLLAFAREVGPICLELAQTDAVRARIASALEAGAPPEDVLLQALFERSQEDAAAADEFMRSWLPEMDRLFRSLGQNNRSLRSIYDTVDVQGDTLRDLWKSWPKLTFTSRAQFRALLRGMLRRALFSMQRRATAQRRQEEMRADADLTQQESTAPTATEEVRLKEMADIAADEIERLPALQREVIRLNIDGLSFDEIAARLDKSTGAVKEALRRARVNLAKSWHERQAREDDRVDRSGESGRRGGAQPSDDGQRGDAEPDRPPHSDVKSDDPPREDCKKEGEDVHDL